MSIPNRTFSNIQLRRGTEAVWEANNPILLAGEIGIETDTNKLKIGNGTDAWNDLDYFVGGGSVSLELDQLTDVNTTGVADGDALVYDAGTSTWVPGESASSVFVSDTAPTSPSAGDLWFDSTDGKTYVYYNDGDSSQWVGLGSGNVGYPLGAVYAWPIETVPSWGLELNGQAVSRTTYSGLFALLGTTYGAGDGSTTFNLPDYRGRTLVGQNSGTFSTLGGNVGSETHSHTLSDAGQAAFDAISGTGHMRRVASESYSATRTITGATADATSSRTVGVALRGSTDSSSTIQPSTVVKWIICATTSTGDFNTEVQTALVTRVSDTPLSQNFVLNGAFDVWQRGTTITHSANPDTQIESYTADRFRVGVVEDGVAWRSVTVTRSTNTIPGYLYSAKVTSNSATVNRASVRQLVEDGEKLIGQTLTFSAFIKRIATTNSGTEIRFRQGATQTVVVTDFNSLSTTEFTRVSHTFTAGSTNDFRWEIVRSGGPLLGTTGDLFEITGIQLELGNTATPFRRASSTLQGELAACQRYYKRIVTSGATQFIANGFAFNATSGDIFFDFPTPMRTTPTFSYDQTASAFIFRHSGGSSGSITSITPRASATSPSSLSLTFASTSMVEGAGYFRSNIAENAWVAFDAEL